MAIDDDVLMAARHIARYREQSLGAVISDLARKGLAPVGPRPASRSGFPLLPKRPGGPSVTLEIVNALRDDPF